MGFSVLFVQKLSPESETRCQGDVDPAPMARPRLYCRLVERATRMGRSLMQLVYTRLPELHSLHRTVDLPSDWEKIIYDCSICCKFSLQSWGPCSWSAMHKARGISSKALRPSATRLRGFWSTLAFIKRYPRTRESPYLSIECEETSVRQVLSMFS
jgi:hypothetical protein